MPILGVTDSRTLSERASLPLIARVYKGEPRVEGKYPKDMDYFRVEFLPQYAEMGEAFRKIYGDQPREFAGIRLVRDELQIAFPTWLEKWSGSSLERRCDGVTCFRHMDKSKQMIYTEVPCICETEKGQPDPKRPGKTKRSCESKGYLSFTLPDFHRVLAESYPQAQNVLGTFLLTVKSLEDMREIGSVLAQAEKLSQGLSSVPFTLGRAQKKIKYNDENGVRRERDSWMLYLNIDAKGLLLSRPHNGDDAHAITDGLSHHEDEPASDYEEQNADGDAYDIPRDIQAFLEQYGIELASVMDANDGEDEIRGNIVRYLVEHGVPVVFESLEVVQGKKHLAVYQHLIGQYHVLETDLKRFLNADLKSVWSQPGVYPYDCVVKLQYGDRPFILKFEQIL